MISKLSILMSRSIYILTFGSPILNLGTGERFSFWIVLLANCMHPLRLNLPHGTDGLYGNTNRHSLRSAAITAHNRMYCIVHTFFLDLIFMPV